jgi:hypothetical protein
VAGDIPTDHIVVYVVDEWGSSHLFVAVKKDLIEEYGYE